MKNALVIIAVVLFGAFGVGYIIDAVLTKEAVREIKNRANNPTSQPVITDAEAKQEFVYGCTTTAQGIDGANVYCVCLYDELREVYSVNQLLNISLNKSEAELEEFMTPYANRCMYQTWGVEEL